MNVRPATRAQAIAWIAEHHRHHRRAVTGWLFGVELVADDGATIGYGICGRPAARRLQDGLTCEITRVATDGTPNACSALYGALRRAAAALGYRRVYTYTLASEPGASVRAAGFVFDGVRGGGEADRPSRPRAPVENPGPKHRWVWPASFAEPK